MFFFCYFISVTNRNLIKKQVNCDANATCVLIVDVFNGSSKYTNANFWSGLNFLAFTLIFFKQHLCYYKVLLGI